MLAFPPLVPMAAIADLSAAFAAGFQIVPTADSTAQTIVTQTGSVSRLEILPSLVPMPLSLPAPGLGASSLRGQVAIVRDPVSGRFGWNAAAGIIGGLNAERTFLSLPNGASAGSFLVSGDVGGAAFLWPNAGTFFQVWVGGNNVAQAEVLRFHGEHGELINYLLTPFSIGSHGTGIGWFAIADGYLLLWIFNSLNQFQAFFAFAYPSNAGALVTTATANAPAPWRNALPDAVGLDVGAFRGYTFRSLDGQLIVCSVGDFAGGGSAVHGAGAAIGLTDYGVMAEPPYFDVCGAWGFSRPLFPALWQAPGGPALSLDPTSTNNLLEWMLPISGNLYAVLKSVTPAKWTLFAGGAAPAQQSGGSGPGGPQFGQGLAAFASVLNWSRPLATTAAERAAYRAESKRTHRIVARRYLRRIG